MVDPCREDVTFASNEFSYGALEFDYKTVCLAYILFRLRKNDFNIAKTADDIGITRRSMTNKVIQFRDIGIHIPKHERGSKEC